MLEALERIVKRVGDRNNAAGGLQSSNRFILSFAQPAALAFQFESAEPTGFDRKNVWNASADAEALENGRLNLATLTSIRNVKAESTASRSRVDVLENRTLQRLLRTLSRPLADRRASRAGFHEEPSCSCAMQSRTWHNALSAWPDAFRVKARRNVSSPMPCCRPSEARMAASRVLRSIALPVFAAVIKISAGRPSGNRPTVAVNLWPPISNSRISALRRFGKRSRGRGSLVMSIS